MKALVLTLTILVSMNVAHAESNYSSDSENDSAEYTSFASNCYAIPPEVLDPTTVCPIDKIWARGAVGGWQCCQHPPVY